MFHHVLDKVTIERKGVWRSANSKASHWYFYWALQIRSTSSFSKRVKVSTLTIYIEKKNNQQHHSVNLFNLLLNLSKFKLLFSQSQLKFKSSNLNLYLWMQVTYQRESQLKMWMTPTELRIWCRWLTSKRVSHKSEPRFSPSSTMLSVFHLKLERKWMLYQPKRG